MDNFTHVWRPLPNIRAISLALPFRDGRLLVSAVCEDDGRTKGWRPLGGGIDFGESAEDAALRELKEEIKAVAQIDQKLGVFENIFSHQGETGHEIVFAFKVRLLSPGLAHADEFIVEDGAFLERAAWIPFEEFQTGRETLLADGLLPLVPTVPAP